jgi:hypothetical protein
VAWPIIAFEIALWPFTVGRLVGALGERLLLAGKGRLAGFAVAGLVAPEAGWLRTGPALEFVVVAHVVFARLRG